MNLKKIKRNLLTAGMVVSSLSTFGILASASCDNQTGTDTPTPTPEPTPKPTPNPGGKFDLTANKLQYNQTAANKKVIENYVADEVKYFNNLKDHLTQNKIDSAEKTYSNTPTAVINKFDNLSKSTYQPYYLDALFKNYSLPNENNYLNLNPLLGVPYGKYDKATPGDRGKTRMFPNEYYKQAALESYSIIFNNSNPLIKNIKGADLFDQRSEMGTAWILDYQLDPSGKYPMKWYLATNLHVASALKNKFTSGDLYSNEPELQKEFDRLNQAYLNEKEWRDKYNAIEAKIKEISKIKGPNAPEVIELQKQLFYNNVPGPVGLEYDKAAKELQAAENAVVGQTNSITISHFNSKTDLDSRFETTALDPNIDTITLQPKQIKIVYAGTDFLTQSPSEYVNSTQDFSKMQEMADFAVLEIDFSKQEYEPFHNQYGFTKRVGSGYQFKPVASLEDLVKEFTSNFATLPADKQSKPANFDILTKYEELSKETVPYTEDGKEYNIPKINVDFIAVGFPNADTDDTIDRKILTDAEKEALKYTSSFWTNKSRDNSKGITNYGNSLSKALGFRNFIDKPGITDITLTSPLIHSPENQGFDLGNFKEVNSPYQGNYYINYGLGYVLSSWQPMKGASGSSVRDINNNIIGINYATADAQGLSLLSLVQALRSPGETYQNQYGRYVLGQYDLIYGGGKNQRTSYRDKLAQMYGSNYQTKLFKNGAGTLDPEYKFKD
ncbi:Ig-specific serine endopeptidase MIP [Mycoplasma hafezii]|uniref:Ig-specific serine endopeptidase MIP n=1 Tax=Mycoplasma hafezii TaxID=525886 RepID=UPI003CED2964